MSKYLKNTKWGCETNFAFGPKSEMRNAKLFAPKNVKNAKDAKRENAKSPSPGMDEKEK